MGMLGRTGAAALILLAVAGAGAASAAETTAAPGDPAGDTGRAIVTLSVPDANAAAADAISAVVRRTGIDPELRIPETGQVVVDLGDETLADLRERLAGDPRLESVHADRPVELRYAPNDPAFALADSHAPFGDLGQWNLTRAGARTAWNLNRGGAAEVAVIDSGAEVTHPDLAPRIAATLDCTPNCGGTTVTDTDGHGTHVAGLACGDSDNAYGIASFGFDCNLFIVRVSLCSSVAQAIVAAANRGSDAINMSLGGCGSDLAPAIDYAWAAGSVPVVAGANDPDPGGNDYPAQRVQPRGSGPSLDQGRGLVVTAARYDGARASFALGSTGVSVAAYGSATDDAGGRQGILSAWPDATTSIETGNVLAGQPPCNCRTSVGGDDRFAYLVGTSMASPQVAGLVALMRSAKPDLAAPKLARLVKLTANSCGSYRNGLGWGIVDGGRAVSAALGRDVDPPASRVRRVNAKRIVVTATEESCSKELPSSGVKKVIVFAAAGGKKYRRVAKTTRRKVAFKAKPGRRYRFYSVAVDGAGNREAAPAVPDAKLRTSRRKG